MTQPYYDVRPNAGSIEPFSLQLSSQLRLDLKRLNH